MSWGRAIASLSAVVAVGATAVLVVGMSQAATGPQGSADPTPFTMPTLGQAPYPAPLDATTSGAAPSPAASSQVPTAARSTTSAARVPSSPPSASRPVATHQASQSTSAAPKPAPIPASEPASKPASKPASEPAPAPKPAPNPAVTGQSLPLRMSTGTATRVITVVARSTGSTTAVLQAWDRAPGGGWLKHGSAVIAHVGSDGLSSSPSESRSATPIGSFTLTQAFGYYGNPGTAMPYFRTTWADWWISQPGSLYNTHQRCSSSCPFALGDPNEHLAAITPEYNYAVVIDYNTRNSPTGVRQGAGSAFFLHVSDGGATAGCVSIPQGTLVSIMRWLTPTAHPRILIGVG